jgi:hypothetical protein
MRFVAKSYRTLEWMEPPPSINDDLVDQPIHSDNDSITISNHNGKVEEKVVVKSDDNQNEFQSKEQLLPILQSTVDSIQTNVSIEMDKSMPNNKENVSDNGTNVTDSATTNVINTTTELPSTISQSTSDSESTTIQTTPKQTPISASTSSSSSEPSSLSIGKLHSYLPSAPNWYCFKIADCSIDGTLAFGSRNSVVVIDLLSGKFHTILHGRKETKQKK